MTQEELLAEVEDELMTLSTEFESTLYTRAYNLASKETGFECPTSEDFEILWLKNRTKRWLFSFKYASSVENFNVPKASLNQIFTNYRDAIKEMDDDYLLAKQENPSMFGIDSGAMFGTVVSSGFVNDDKTGENLTYESTGNVLINGE